MIPRLLTAIAVTVCVTACGSSASASPQDSIRTASHAYINALRHDRVGAACRLTSDHQSCLAKFAGIHALGIKPSDTLNGSEDKRIDGMKITVDGAHARDSRGTRFVKRDGKWLLVLKNS